ncbi:MAG: hypothetical protein LBI58_02235 [Tannerellaceae bacterium]|jgi:hypothetical protein|nr:hypothetical protein [Tannerellaceae bacterium]
MSYVEITDQGVLLGIYPLEEEIPSTEFYDGLLFIVPAGAALPHPITAEDVRRSGITDRVSSGDKIHLYRIHGETIVLVNPG